MKVHYLLFIYLLSIGLIQGQSADSLARLAIRHDPELIRAAHQVERAKLEQQAAGSLAPIELNFSLGGIEDFSRIDRCDEKSLGLSKSFSWPGIRTAKHQSAGQAIQLAELELEQQLKLKTRSILDLLLHRSYHTKLSGRCLNLISILHNLSDITQIRYGLKQSPYSDLVTIRMELTLLEQELADHHQNRAELETRLKIITGCDSLPDPDSSILEPTELPYSSAETAQEELTRQSFRYRIIQIQQAKLETNRKLNRLELIPVLSLGISHDWNENDPPYNLNDYHGRPGKSWGIEGTFSIPLFFLSASQVPAKTAELESRIDRQINTLISQAQPQTISDTYRRLTIRIEQLNRFQQSILHDGEIEMHNLLDRYAAGNVPLSEVILYLHNLTHYRNEYEEARLQYGLALNELKVCAEIDPYTEKETDHEN